MTRRAWFGGLTAALLATELLDELVFGAREAAWPLIRADLDLSYTEIGLLLSIPAYVSAVVEPALGLLGDTRWRRAVVVGGGIAFAAALALAAVADAFLPLLVAFVVLFFAAGAFVTLSQATLMDLAPERREQNMARWSVAGGIGAVGGPLLLTGLVAVGLGWRELFGAFALVTVVLLATTARWPAESRPAPARPSVRAMFGALRRREVIRWLVLLELVDLMLDILLGFLALYFVDEVATSVRVAGVAVATWPGAALVGGFGIVLLLRRVSGLRYLRASAVVAAGLYATFLLVPGTAPKLLALALLGFATAGWYSIPKARLYASLPGQSGAAMSLSGVAGLVGGVWPLAIALLAERYGLETALWFLLTAPLALLIGAPRRD